MLRTNRATASPAVAASLAVQYQGKAPREGTALRALYDVLMANKGQVVSIAGLAGPVGQLENFYGFDLHRVGVASAKVVGRQVGLFYHDYVAGRVVHQRDR